MSLTFEQQQIREKIFHDHLGLFGCPENFGVRAMFASEIDRVLKKASIQDSKYRVSEAFYIKLMDLEYFYRVQKAYIEKDEIQKVKMEEGFTSRDFDDLSKELEESFQADWHQKVLYYLALYEVVSDLLEELGVPIGHTYLTT